MTAEYGKIQQQKTQWRRVNRSCFHMTFFILAAVIGSNAPTHSEPSINPPELRPAVRRAPDQGLKSCEALPKFDTKYTYRALARCEANRWGLPPELAETIMQIESEFDPDAIGAAGEIGLMQVKLTTAQLLGFKGTPRELASPGVNIRLGVRYLAEAWTHADKDICTAVMKYRAGHGETRFSMRSVNYCLRAREILAKVGFPVTGKVPEPTLGLQVARYDGSGTRKTQALKRWSCVSKGNLRRCSYMSEPTFRFNVVKYDRNGTRKTPALKGWTCVSKENMRRCSKND